MAFWANSTTDLTALGAPGETRRVTVSARRTSSFQGNLIGLTLLERSTVHTLVQVDGVLAGHDVLQRGPGLLEAEIGEDGLSALNSSRMHFRESFPRRRRISSRLLKTDQRSISSTSCLA